MTSGRRLALAIHASSSRRLHGNVNPAVARRLLDLPWIHMNPEGLTCYCRIILVGPINLAPSKGPVAPLNGNTFPLIGLATPKDVTVARRINAVGSMTCPRGLFLLPVIFACAAALVGPTRPAMVPELIALGMSKIRILVAVIL